MIFVCFFIGVLFFVIQKIRSYLIDLYDLSSIRFLRQQKNQAKERRKHAILDYNPLHSNSLACFRSIAQKSQCLFAKNANLWGCPNFNESVGLTENIMRMIPSILKFITLADDGENLDGYVIEIIGKKYCSEIKSFAATVRCVLEVLSSQDPSGLDVMKFKSISSYSWYFSLSNIPIFITTFAPFYSKSHCRYFHPLSSLENSCYILLQPEISFLRHNIGEDTPLTNWENPQTIRDRIRKSFQNHRRGYYIPSSNRYNVAEMIVLHPETNEQNFVPIQFWRKDIYPDVE